MVESRRLEGFYGVSQEQVLEGGHHNPSGLSNPLPSGGRSGFNRARYSQELCHDDFLASLLHAGDQDVHAGHRRTACDLV